MERAWRHYQHASTLVFKKREREKEEQRNNSLCWLMSHSRCLIPEMTHSTVTKIGTAHVIGYGLSASSPNTSCVSKCKMLGQAMLIGGWQEEGGYFFQIMKGSLLPRETLCLPPPPFFLEEKKQLMPEGKKTFWQHLHSQNHQNIKTIDILLLERNWLWSWLYK